MSVVRSAVLAAALSAGVAVSAPATEKPALDWAALPLIAIDGAALSPETFRGKVVLVVNTASQCGYTPQYDGLQALWTRYRQDGLVVLGVPSNDFGGQEPGSNDEIASFCQLNYGVDFPLLEKQSVTGQKAHPLYRWAKDVSGAAAVPRWNFHKLLIGRDGRLIEPFASSVTPDAPVLRSAVEQALSNSSPGTASVKR